MKARSCAGWWGSRKSVNEAIIIMGKIPMLNLRGHRNHHEHRHHHQFNSLILFLVILIIITTISIIIISSLS